MPDVVVHVSIGEQAVRRLDPEISKLIRPEVFRFAVMAPDLYFSYRFFAPHLRRGINRRSSDIHHTGAAGLLMTLAENCARPEAFSCLCGYLCHYAADATLHPLVYALQGDRKYIHMAIEHRLEVIELKRQGKALKDVAKLLPAYPEVPEARAVAMAYFGWNGDREWIAYRHMRLQYRLLKDRSGLLNLLLGRLGGRAAALSYRTRLADGLDLSPFDALEARAVDYAAKLMTAAYRYRAGTLADDDLASLIGDKNYSGEEAQ